MQPEKRILDSALGKSDLISQYAQTRLDWSPALANGASIKKQIDEKGRRLLIVADNIAHKNIQDVIIDWHSPFEARHSPSFVAIPIIGQDFSTPSFAWV
jgi:hypothetical protein